MAVQNVPRAGETRGSGGFCTVLGGCAALSDAQNCFYSGFRLAVAGLREHGIILSISWVTVYAKWASVCCCL